MEEDLKLRKEFAKAFDWYSRENSYGYSRQELKLKEPTWEEIFVELGKVLERAKIEITCINNTNNPIE